jgi:D-glycero-alpha-D-manno-heptose-7-phosphate kinase
MILSKTPLRVSFFGGGSDLPAFYREDRGAVLSTTISQFVFVSVKRKFDQKIRLSYSQTETVESVEELKHDLVRTALGFLGLSRGLEITSISDLPSNGTGMGSSSAFLVGLLNALYHHRGDQPTNRQLAEEACFLEIDHLAKPIGRQDQYAAALGGLNHLTFHPDDRVTADPVRCDPVVLREFQSRLMLLHTGVSRSADPILRTQSSNTRTSPAVRSVIRQMVALADEFRDDLRAGDLSDFARMLDEAWELKVQMANGISNSWIDHLVGVCRDNGAESQKLMGAGGGGFLLVYAQPDAQARICKALPDLIPLPVRFEPRGSRIVYSE